MPPKQRSSNCWLFFEVFENEKKAKCSICSHTISFTSGNTSNLNRHLKLKHPTVPLGPQARQSFSEDPDPDHPSSSSNSALIQSSTPQPKIFNFLRPTKVPESVSKRVDTQLIRMMVKEYQPLRLVEDIEFKKFIDLVSQCPGYTLPSRKTISEGMIPSHYQQIKDQVLVRLTAASAVCLTSDTWTSINCQSFLAVTAHFVEDNSVELASCLLDCVKFDDKHTSANIAKKLLDIVESFKIENKITAIVSDNAYNIVGAVKINKWRHVPCFAHTLNLIVQDALKSNLQGTLKKLKAIVEFFKRSTTANAKLSSTKEQLGLPDLKLKQSVDTRWNSTYEMLSRALKLREAIITSMALIDCKNLEPLTSDEWKTVSQAEEVLEIFSDITVEVSSEKSVSLSKVIIYVETLKKTLSELTNKNELLPQMIKLVQELKDGVTKRFSYVTDLAIECTLLDPRFKKVGFMGDTIKFQKAYENIKTKLQGTFKLQAATVSLPDVHIDGPTPPKKSKNMWSKFDKFVEISKGQSNHLSAAIVQFDRYMQEEPLNRLENPLLWWEERRKIYPQLYIIAKRRLCIVATSVPCERIFSKTGNILNERRNRLKADKVSQIIFLNHNW